MYDIGGSTSLINHVLTEHVLNKFSSRFTAETVVIETLRVEYTTVIVTITILLLLLLLAILYKRLKASFFHSYGLISWKTM